MVASVRSSLVKVVFCFKANDNGYVFITSMVRAYRFMLSLALLESTS